MLDQSKQSRIQYAPPDNAYARKLRSVSPSTQIRHFAMKVRAEYRRLKCVLKIAYRIFVGHTQELLSTRRGACLGLVYRLLPDGSHCKDERTEFRTDGIETIARSRPWASTVEFRIFLEGFGWGERFALRNPDTQASGDIQA